MSKKQSSYHVFGLLSIIVLVSGIFAPLTASAQSYWGGRDRELINEWRQRASSLSRKIDDLDSKAAERLPVPILFGITPDDISRNFGDPRGTDRLHEGLDIMAPRRAPVVSPTEAVVIRVGVGDSAGNYVYTANPGEETFAYMHLDEIADIEEGDELQKGDLIGYVGNTGNASGGATHLHFEIRLDHEATDPYERMARIFPIADKIEYLEKILDEADDEKETAESIVTLYRSELILAQSLDIALPVSITKAMTRTIVAAATSVTRTLRVGLRGEDVKALQTALGISADGDFGPKTRAAVIAFQISKKLSPDGVFGPASRLALLGNAIYPKGCVSSTGYSPDTGIKCDSLL